MRFYKYLLFCLGWNRWILRQNRGANSTEQDCRNGSPTYYAGYEIYPQLSRTAAETPVMPRDIITASVTYTGNNNKLILSMTCYNPSTGQTPSFSKTASLPAQRSSTEWIVETPFSVTRELPLAKLWYYII